MSFIPRSIENLLYPPPQSDRTSSTALRQIARWFERVAHRPLPSTTNQSNGVQHYVVGGLTFGGSGKTAICRDLAERSCTQKRVALLVHNFRGKSLPKPIQLHLNSNNRWSPKLNISHHYNIQTHHLGDEAVMLRALLPANVQIWYGGSRVDRYHAAIDSGAELIISDGGLFDHALPRTHNILTLDASVSWDVIPCGALKQGIESMPNLSDSILWIHHGLSFTSQPDRFQYLKQDAICTEYEPHDLINENDQYIPLNTLSKKSVIPICGIARPHSFIQQLIHLGAEVQKPVILNDHGYLSYRQQQYLSKNNESMKVITAKDSARLSISGAMILDVRLRYIFNHSTFSCS